MKFFDLEMSGLAGGFVKKGNVLKDISYEHPTPNVGGCAHTHYRDGHDEDSCYRSSFPGQSVSIYVANSGCTFQK